MHKNTIFHKKTPAAWPFRQPVFPFGTFSFKPANQKYINWEYQRIKHPLIAKLRVACGFPRKQLLSFQGIPDA